ncbi:hypothetical protein BV22DRAFT_1046770 [Leucogyrophana mollusca]|uniref:Uncharacterized protein n=1 Tax=Leucogyrophana mollusca TaxID=85980 RepID=A0ACB8BHU7_9AGAM|nr:hypothetical protein BV22DRAFT_1046770 [Leucogyrophana mollusca]
MFSGSVVGHPSVIGLDYPPVQSRIVSRWEATNTDKLPEAISISYSNPIDHRQMRKFATVLGIMDWVAWWIGSSRLQTTNICELSGANPCLYSDRVPLGQQPWYMQRNGLSYAGANQRLASTNTPDASKKTAHLKPALTESTQTDWPPSYSAYEFGQMVNIPDSLLEGGLRSQPLTISGIGSIQSVITPSLLGTLIPPPPVSPLLLRLQTATDGRQDQPMVQPSKTNYRGKDLA